MLVTAIEPRRKGLSAVYIDGELAMKLDTQTLLERHIKPGTELTDEELHGLIGQSDTRRAKEKALNLISYRDHSKKELTDKIKRTCSEQAAQAAADRMEELGLVDDEAYARRLARELIYKKHLSPTAASYKLREKGVGRELIEEILMEYEVPAQEQVETLLKGKFANKIADEKSRRRTVAALQRMGYRWGDIKPVLEELAPAEEEY